MKISVFGAGYTGLVHAVCLAEVGHEVFCCDCNEEIINKLNDGLVPFSENGLEELLKKNRTRLIFSTSAQDAVRYGDCVFIAVGTPGRPNGSADLDCVDSVCNSITKYLNGSKIVVVKSTVPAGTCDMLQKKMNKAIKLTGFFIDVVSNPEFLSQGTAIRDWFYGPRIVVGVKTANAETIMKEIYSEMRQPVFVTDCSSAEMIKYASNDFLALKISYINEIANICEIVGANIDDVSSGMGLDERIGSKFLKAGIGYGGSCFSKDTKALHWLARTNGCDLKTVKSAIDVNESQRLRLIQKARKDFRNFKGLKVAVLGATFKPGTDDVRESPAIDNINFLLNEGASIKLWEASGYDKTKEIFMNKVEYTASIEEAVYGSDLCMIFTEHKDVVDFDVKKYSELMKTSMLYDGRNCYSVERMTGVVKSYQSIGRRDL